jgi:hypothetical protein
MSSLNTYLKQCGGRIRFLKGQDFSLKCLEKGIPALRNGRHNNRTPFNPRIILFSGAVLRDRTYRCSDRLLRSQRAQPLVVSPWDLTYSNITAVSKSSLDLSVQLDLSNIYLVLLIQIPKREVITRGKFSRGLTDRFRLIFKPSSSHTAQQLETELKPRHHKP